MKSLIITAIVVGISTSIIYFTLYYQKIKIKGLLANPAYAMGEITSYIQGSGYDQSIHYTFSVDEKQYYNWIYTNLRDISSIKKGDMFIVVYKKDNPKTCVLNFKYPVRDNSDYKNYIAQFKATPPEFGVLKIGTNGGSS